MLLQTVACAVTILLGAEPQPGLDAPQPAKLTLESIGAWRAIIEPNDESCVDLKIDWETTVRDGARRANVERKPLMIYVMNGHPLGCT